MDNLFYRYFILFFSFTLTISFVFSLLFLFSSSSSDDSVIAFEKQKQKQKQEPNFLNYFVIQGVSYNKLLLSINTDTSSITSDNDNQNLINSSNTFYTKGLLSTVLYPDNAAAGNMEQNSSGQLNSQNQTSDDILLLYDYPKLVSGTWSLNVSKGYVTDFQTAFKLLGINGIEKHSIEIMNFQNSNDSSSVIFDQFSNTPISGFADIKIDNEIFQNKSPIKIQIFKINTIVLTIEDDDISNIFYNNDLLGITDSFKNFENDELLIFDDDNDGEE